MGRQSVLRSCMQIMTAVRSVQPANGHFRRCCKICEFARNFGRRWPLLQGVKGALSPYSMPETCHIGTADGREYTCCSTPAGLLPCPAVQNTHCGCGWMILVQGCMTPYMAAGHGSTLPRYVSRILADLHTISPIPESRDSTLPSQTLTSCKYYYLLQQNTRGGSLPLQVSNIQ